MNIIKKLLPLIIVIFLSFWAIKPLLYPGFFPIHDDTQIARVFEMTKSLKDGMLPVRWVADLGFGYGYPIFNFYAPFSYYVGSIFNLIGFDALMATKIMMGFGIILAGIFMYFFAKELFGRIGGIVAALFYVYAPYHALDIYVRGDVSEFWAYSFIPLVFYALWKVYKNNNWGFLIIASLGYAGVILSHNLTAMMITPFLFFYILLLGIISYKQKRRNTIFYLFLSLIFGVLISSFYWLPALAEMKYSNVLSQIGGGASFLNHFVCLSQLWSSPWGYGGSVVGCIDGLSFMIGKLHILVSIIVFILTMILLVRRNYKENIDKLLIIILFFLGFIVSIALLLDISKSLWQTVPLMAFFQFPWRFLLMISFFSSVLAGGFIWILSQFKTQINNKNLNFVLSALLLVVLLLLNSKFFVSQTILNNNSSYYTNDAMLRFTVSKISHEYMPKNFLIPKNLSETSNGLVRIQSGSLKIDKLDKTTQSYKIFVNAKTSSYILIPIANFPSWRLSIDGKQTSFIAKNNGIVVLVPPGVHMVSLNFNQTPIEKFSDLVSLAGIAVLFIGIILSGKKHYGK